MKSGLYSKGTFFVLAAVGIVALSLAVQPASAATVLFHGSGVDATDGADGAVLTHLESRYGAPNVTYMQGEMAAADGSSANGFNLVVISSTINSGTVRNKYEDTPAGVVNWEQALNRARTGEFNMSQDGASGNDQTELTIVDPTSPLAAGLSGTVTVFDAPSTVQLGSNALGAGVNLVASEAGGDNRHAIFSADVGDALLGDGSEGNPAVAPGRRVMFFIQDSSFNNLTTDGIALFDAATDWASVPEPASGLLVLVGGCILMMSRRRRQ